MDVEGPVLSWWKLVIYFLRRTKFGEVSTRFLLSVGLWERKVIDCLNLVVGDTLVSLLLLSSRDLLSGSFKSSNISVSSPETDVGDLLGFLRP